MSLSFYFCWIVDIVISMITQSARHRVVRSYDISTVEEEAWPEVRVRLMMTPQPIMQS